MKGRAEAWLQRYGPALAVLLLCLGSAAAKVYVNAARDGIAHGDAGYYLTLARNLASGRGFVIDYVPDFFSGERRIPYPANTYWMPLTSVVLAAVMAVFGQTFAVAKGTMIAVSSLAPAVAYLLGREMFAGRRPALVAAFLAAASEGYLTAACQPQSHALVLVLGGLWFLLALRARRAERWLPWLGALTGLMHLTRGDGVLYLGVLGLMWLVPDAGRPRWSFRGLAKLALAYALVMAPFWARNLAVLGTPMPPNLGRVAFLVDYSQLYSLPESLTPTSFLDAGWDAIRASKVKALETNSATQLFGAVTGNERTESIRSSLREIEPHQWPVLALVWLGWPLLLRRRFLPVWGMVLVFWSFFTLVFSPTGLASLRASLFPAYLAYFAAAGRALELGLGWSAARLPAPRLARAGLAAMAVLLLAWTGAAGVERAASRTRRGVAFIHDVEARHAELMRQVIEPLGLRDAVIMTWDVHELHVHTGLKLVMVPHEPVETIHRVALEFGVTHVLLFGVVEQHAEERPGLAAIPGAKDRFELIYRDQVRGEAVRVYRVLPPG